MRYTELSLLADRADELLSGRVLFDDSLSSYASISSYLDTLVSSPFGTICTSSSAVPLDGGYVTVVVPA
jgi:hypothetical protein